HDGDASYMPPDGTTAVFVGDFIDRGPGNERTLAIVRRMIEANRARAVFDVTGRKVRTLARGVFLAGEQDVVWDGVDERGRAVPSGVYLVRLDAGGEVGVSRKVQLVR
ncbi:hypothetical protein GF314_02715, partial [bacterium]|nr:hypothetical protein [bacterium]